MTDDDMAWTTISVKDDTYNNLHIRRLKLNPNGRRRESFDDVIRRVVIGKSFTGNWIAGDSTKRATIVVRKKTHNELKDRKQMKPHGVPESFDDVIRRALGLAPIEDKP